MGHTYPKYAAKVLEVISGDDLQLFVDLGIDDLWKKVRVRLHGVDTPDAYHAKPETPAGAIRDRVKELARKQDCEIEVHEQKRGGWIVTLHIPHAGPDGSSLNLNTALIEEGYVFRHKKGGA